MATRKKSDTSVNNDKINADELNMPSEPTVDEHEALAPFQPVVMDVNNAHQSLGALAWELQRHIDTQSPGMSGEQLRAFSTRLTMAVSALGDSIAPVNEVSGAAQPDPEQIPEPAEAAQATSDQT